MAPIASGKLTVGRPVLQSGRANPKSVKVVRLASVSDDSSAKTKDSGFFVAIGKALSALQRKLTRTEEDAAKAATQHMIEVQHASEQAQLDFEKKLNEQEPH